MICYAFDDDGVYIGETIAQPSPREPGKHFLPANATFDEPPVNPGGHMVRRRGLVEVEGEMVMSWVTVEDRRGVTYWLNGTATVQEDFGPLPEGASLAAPVPDPTVADVHRERDRRLLLSKGISVTAYSVVIALQMRPDDQTNLIGLSQAAQLRIANNDPQPFNFRDADNVVHPLLPAQMLEFAVKAAEWKTEIWAASWVLVDNPPIPADYADDSHWPSHSTT